jgi:exosortase
MPPPQTSSEVRPVERPPAVFSWQVLLWFGVLLGLAYGPVLYRLVKQWMDDPDMGHGLFVPLVAGYIVWQRREQLLAIPVAANWWGLALVLWGAIQLTVATLGVELFLARTAFWISLAGSILLLFGSRMLRALVFPLLLLAFMIPIPAIIFNQITLPLQFLASGIAEVALGLLGVPVIREGNILELPSQRLSVVEACSGIRSLLSLSFLSLVYGYFFDPKAWMRWILLAVSLPIAILVNALRVTLTGIISEYSRALADGVFHAIEGWMMFILALAILILVHRFIARAWAVAHGEGG